MEEVITLIDKIIEEHNVVIQRIKSLEQVTNDIEAIVGFKRAEEASIPVRFEQKQTLQKLLESLEAISQGLREHFNREETALLTAFEKHGDRKLFSSFCSLLLEHENLRNCLVVSRKHVAQLISGEVPQQAWGKSVEDMQAHINHARKLLEAHAGSEQGLLLLLRSGLVQAQKRDD